MIAEKLNIVHYYLIMQAISLANKINFAEPHYSQLHYSTTLTYTVHTYKGRSRKTAREREIEGPGFKMSKD